MPAQVPAGYTRGPLLFLGAITANQHEEMLLQSLWDEAGGYGARLLILPASTADRIRAQYYADLFSSWQSGVATQLLIENRAAASAASAIEAVNNATGILIVGQNPLAFTSIYGGTPLAQAIRRANAQGKIVAAKGGAASVLCQHMIAFDNRHIAPRPLLHRQLIQFAPGLGLINRVVLDAAAAASDNVGERISRLLLGVAYNPFLVGVSLEADTGIALYANGAMEVFGKNSALVIDGSQLQESNLHEVAENNAVSVLGVQLHVLTHGYTFNLEDRSACAPATNDLPPINENAKAAF